ncbi:Hypothetical protein BHY_1289 (plasmid) [Borrelia nietonii YOR]|uniref:Uncharacterized protein n=1 Tax=Borrelia nietonii YOR TaxID=1293576 RepID=W5SBC2_9SPIR|nr:DUF1322 family protein [Borrelia nietonii]AHH04240.1 Hypothetical protein BHY_1289 [Borrelia nietonii YOR]UPA09609.1 DUF1322 family protein [Borrelia nietonii YOR]
MHNKDTVKFIKNLENARERYFNLIEKVQNNKYWLPVFTNVCSYNDVKKMYYDELNEVNKIAEAKIEKQILELILSK